MDALRQKIKDEEQKLLTQCSLLPSSFSLPDDSDFPNGPIFEKIREECQTFTNFTEAQLLDLWRDVDPKINQRRGRGPKPKIDSLDSLIVFLVHAKTNMDVQELAAHLGINEGPARAAIDRVREPLLAALGERWGNKPRPVPLRGHFQDIALLVDSTTIPVFRHDFKNRIHGFKKEVAVQASEPHFALFIQEKADGSLHDYTIFKDHYKVYEEYLTKTPEERESLGPDNWSILGDNAYQGPDSDNPGVKRIFLQKAPENHNEDYEELKTKRVPVECFFGRLKHLWLMCTVYRSAHIHFNSDIDICILLTNEHIKGKPLHLGDQRSFLAHIAQQRQESEEKKAKKRKYQEDFKARKKSRIEELLREN